MKLRPSSQGGFTLLEVLIAMSILATSLVILAGAQATAVKMIQDAEDVVTATMLAKDVMTRVELFLEDKGFGENDIEDQGDFREDYPGDFDDFSFHYSVHRIDLDLGNVQGLLGAFGDGGEAAAEAEGESGTEQMGAPQTLGDLGIDLSMFDDQIARYIRAIEVTVTWQRGSEPEEVTLVTHVVNPTGRVVSADQQEEIGGLPSLSGGTSMTVPAGGSTGSAGGDK